MSPTRSPFALGGGIIACALIGAASSAACAAPASPDSIAAGRAFAEGNCAACHATGESGASPNPHAPPLRDLHLRYPLDGLREAFLKGMEVGHRGMPTFVMRPQQVNDIVAYLRSLDPCGRPSSDKAAMARCFTPMEP